MRCCFAVVGVLLLGLCQLSACTTSEVHPASAPPELAGAAPQVQPAMGGLPALSDLRPRLNPVQGRASSYVPADLLRQGEAFETDLPHQRVTATAGGAAFDPNWRRVAADPADLAYAMYAFAVPGYDGNARLYTGWVTPPPDWGDVYVALANWGADRWDWFGVAADGTAQLPGTAPYIVFGGALVACVVVIDTNPCELDWLRLGSLPPQPALSATPTSGITPITVDFDATGSSDPDGTIAEYRWDPQGDGTFEASSGTDPTFSFEYTGGGPYAPAVRVIDDDGVYAKLSVELDVVETINFTYGGATLDEEPEAVVVSDGYMHLFGELDEEGQSFHIKLSPTGRQLFAKVTAADHIVYDAIAAPDGAIYACGADFTAPGTSATLLQKWSTDGTLLWSKSMTGTDADLRFSALLYASGGLFACGKYYADGLFRDFGFVARFDPDGNLVWARTLIGPEWAQFADISAFLPAESGSSSIRMCGTYWTAADNIDCLYAAFDLDGNLLECKTWGATGVQEHGLVISTTGKTFAFTCVGAEVRLSNGDAQTMLGQPGGTTVIAFHGDVDQVIPWSLVGQTVGLRKYNFAGPRVVLATFDSALNITLHTELIADGGGCTPEALAQWDGNILVCGDQWGSLPEESPVELVVQPSAVSWTDRVPSIGSPSQFNVVNNPAWTDNLPGLELNSGSRDVLLYLYRQP